MCEIQLNHIDMLVAKKESHVYYETVRKELPALFQGTEVDAEKPEAFIVGRLSTSSLDAAVEALSAKAEGLFLYAYMLGQHLESEATATRFTSRTSTRSRPAWARFTLSTSSAPFPRVRTRVDRGGAHC